MDYIYSRFGLHVDLEQNVMGDSAFELVDSNLTDAERDNRERDFNYNYERPYPTTVSSRADTAGGGYIRRTGKLANPPVGTRGVEDAGPRSTSSPRGAADRGWVISRNLPGATDGCLLHDIRKQ